VLPFSDTILFRGIGTSESMQDAMSGSEVLEGSGNIFSSIISLQLFNGGGEQVFNKVLKFYKAWEDI